LPPSVRYRDSETYARAALLPSLPTSVMPWTRARPRPGTVPDRPARPAGHERDRPVVACRQLCAMT